MSKRISSKVKEIYDYITSKNKESVQKGNKLLPICYAVILDKNKTVSIMDIPLYNYVAGEVDRILKETGKVLKQNKANVKMFMYTTQGNVTNNKTGESSECLIFSARDCYNNKYFQILEILRGETIDFKKKISHSPKDWKDGKKKNDFKDTLLDIIWFEYKNVR